MDAEAARVLSVLHQCAAIRSPKSDISRELASDDFKNSVCNSHIFHKTSGAEVALPEHCKVEEQRLRAIVYEEPRNLQHPVFKLYVPKSVSLSLLELNPGILEVSDAVKLLLPPFISLRISVRPPPEPEPGDRLSPLVQETSSEDIEAMQAALIR
ncbi:hypothetical protein Nepgr_027063 [Nepenthes gracilis]|uniref:Uncharacterized protein n=1 Tax=Nepenthes gracilis TaxID=150966 RepID=A0AAD3T802_NEPGR|nr:hypothetical protein Nepgr_027063 [Nepenthes gracilis]